MQPSFYGNYICVDYAGGLCRFNVTRLSLCTCTEKPCYWIKLHNRIRFNSVHVYVVYVGI